MAQAILSFFINDGMIIQRDSPFPIYSSKKLSITFLGKTYESQSTISQNDSKQWLITLDPVPAGGPFVMEVTCGENTFFINDIYTGDVWLCSGQSNMEMQMSRLKDDFGEEWELSEYPIIRQFMVPREYDFCTERDDLSGGSWLSSSAETLHEFSSVAWFFARELYRKYKIPIGLVNTAWGGTPVEAWMSKEALSDFPGKIAEAQNFASPAYCEEISSKANAAIEEWETNLRNKDTGLAEGWQNPGTDIFTWNDITLPGDFAEAGINQFCGVIWLAKDFEVSAEFAAQNAKVWLGTIIDADIVYINGKEIGNTGYRYPPRKYVPQGLLNNGKNRIVIRVTCNNGDGGVTTDKPFRIFTANNSIDNSVDLCGTWKYKIGATGSVQRPAEFFFHRQPVCNYNAMIAPIIKYPFKGVIWYQGESNDSAPHEYAALFQIMIKDWRKNNPDKNLPFLFVQLPIWHEASDNDENHNWALLREAQTSALYLPATGMAAALELGEWNDLHPLNKKDVGIRLFYAAEKVLFNVNNTSPGPMFKHLEKQQNKLVIYFNNCGSGLKAVDGKPYVSLIDGGDHIRLPAEIQGIDFITVDISTVKNPEKLLYAWADNPKDRQLFNNENLPVIPFRDKL
jgi:sialate O-acetylesterase